MNYRKWIGKKVRKCSNKPFKSGEKINTVKGLFFNNNSGKMGFLFEEDDSVVDCFICRLNDVE
tara:strand:+ start:3405 stop:3593 length:189 start_codon:yes stop_codon:yes gene_type:complete